MTSIILMLSSYQEARENVNKLRHIRHRWTHVLEEGFCGDDRKAALDILKRMAENAEKFLHKAYKHKHARQHRKG